MRSPGIVDLEYEPLLTREAFREAADRACSLDDLGEIVSRVARQAEGKPRSIFIQHAPRRYRSRRARKAAFAHRARCARHLLRVARALGEAYNEKMSAAWRNLLVYGIAVVSPDRGLIPAGEVYEEAGSFTEEGWRNLVARPAQAGTLPPT